MAQTVSLFDDLREGITSWRLWTALAHERLTKLYRHTRLGLVWVGAGFLAFAMVKIVVFSGLGDEGTAYFATWLVSGFLVWFLISGFVSNACNVFINSKNWITGVSLPYSVYIFRSVWVLAIQTSINFLVAMGVMFAFGQFVPHGILIGLVAFPMLFVMAIPLYVILGTICAYSRDLLQSIQTFMRIMFFATPIIWTPKPGTIREVFAEYNPFSYLLMLYREPVLTGHLPMKAVVVWAIFTVVFWVTGYLVYRRHRNEIVYWL